MTLSEHAPGWPRFPGELRLPTRHQIFMGIIRGPVSSGLLSQKLMASCPSPLSFPLPLSAIPSVNTKTSVLLSLPISPTGFFFQCDSESEESHQPSPLVVAKPTIMAMICDLMVIQTLALLLTDFVITVHKGTVLVRDYGRWNLPVTALGYKTINPCFHFLQLVLTVTLPTHYNCITSALIA